MCEHSGETIELHDVSHSDFASSMTELNLFHFIRGLEEKKLQLSLFHFTGDFQF